MQVQTGLSTWVTSMMIFVLIGCAIILMDESVSGTIRLSSDVSIAVNICGLQVDLIKCTIFTSRNCIKFKFSHFFQLRICFRRCIVLTLVSVFREVQSRIIL